MGGGFSSRHLRSYNTRMDDARNSDAVTFNGDAGSPTIVREPTRSSTPVDVTETKVDRFRNANASQA